MRCVICGSRGYDGAIDSLGEFVCVDCWACGDAKFEGRVAKTASPAGSFYTSVVYPRETLDGFVDACNGVKRGHSGDK